LKAGRKKFTPSFIGADKTQHHGERAMQTIKITMQTAGHFLGPVLHATTPGKTLRGTQTIDGSKDHRQQAQEFAAFCAAKWWKLSLSGFGDLTADAWVATLEGSLYSYEEE